MYFLIEPKSKKDDFFNYHYEYREIKEAIKRGEKIISVLGVRRAGKTSLLNVIFNETKSLKLWIDGRIVSSPKKEIFSAIYDIAKAGKPKIFGKIESLNISAFGIGLDIKVASESLQKIEKKIKSSKQIYIFIDEAQRMDIKELSDVLSYFYDRFSNVSFIVSGSEVGLIEDVLGEEDSKHPLYGRHITKIIMNRLDKNRAFEFLSRGFEQANLKIKKDEIYEAIEELDGLVGWLTLYGYERGIVKNKHALKKTIEIAARIVATELTNFLKKSKNKNLYLSIIRNSTGIKWDELRTISAKDLGEPLNPSLFTFAIKKLVKYSFLEKRNNKYYLSDPLLLKASFLVA